MMGMYVNCSATEMGQKYCSYCVLYWPPACIFSFPLIFDGSQIVLMVPVDITPSKKIVEGNFKVSVSSRKSTAYPRSSVCSKELLDNPGILGLCGLTPG